MGTRRAAMRERFMRKPPFATIGCGPEWRGSRGQGIPLLPGENTLWPGQFDGHAETETDRRGLGAGSFRVDPFPVLLVAYCSARFVTSVARMIFAEPGGF